MRHMTYLIASLPWSFLGDENFHSPSASSAPLVTHTRAQDKVLIFEIEKKREKLQFPGNATAAF